MKVNILTRGLRSYNGIAFLTPLILNQKRLKEIGVEIKFFTKITKNLTNCDILILESKFFVPWWINTDKLFTTFKNLKKENLLYYFDLGDSSSSWCLGILPYVDRMYKSYVFKDKSLYLKPLYGGRLWTDFYHKEFSINDDKESGNPAFYADKDNLNKIKVGYSAAFGNYTLDSIFWQDNIKAKIAKRLWCLRSFSVQKVKESNFVNRERNNNISARMSTNMYTDTVAFQRVKTAEILEKYNVPSTKLKRREYMQELAYSKIVVSPFGWGELNAPRDYEVAMAGSILLKPDFSHLQNWPPIFNDKTVVQYKWDFSDLESKIDDILCNYSDYADYATNLQENYKYYVTTEDGQNDFCLYFKGMLE